MKGAEAMSTSEGSNESGRSIAEREVVERIGELRDALKDALEAYPKVSLGLETIEPHGAHEMALARAQRMLEGLRGLLEQQRAQGRYREERTTAQFEAGVSHLSQFLAIRADLVNAAVRHGDPHHLVNEYDSIMNTLLLLQQTANDGTYSGHDLANAA